MNDIYLAKMYRIYHPLNIMKGKHTLIVNLLTAAIFWVLCIPEQCISQTAAIQGIITDSRTGQPLEGANIVLQQSGEERLRGMAAGPNGFYQISGLPSGEYFLRITFIGYAAYEEILLLANGETETISVALLPDDEQLGVLVVSVPGTGAAGMEAGRQRVDAADFRRVPTPAGSGDLASYLQAMPGIVSTGDRGGQFYIRGGTSAENMVLVDGTLIFQPFHILGFFSAFPETIVSGADVYAGGFGARYNGRTSSVIDVKMRNGDRYQTRGSASVSPFVGEVVVEGPLTRGRTSWIASVRRSLVEESSPMFLGETYPLRFESQYFKMTHFGLSDTRCSLMALRTYDRGRLDIDMDDMVSWTNFITGGQCVILPEGANMLFDINAGLSFVSNATGQGNTPELTSDAMRFNLDVNLTRFFSQARFDYGLFVHIHSLNYDMRELSGGPQLGSDNLLSTGAYSEITLSAGTLELKPGIVMAFYMGDYSPNLEPRFRAIWQPWGREEEQLSAALGLYRQPLAGVHGTRDAGSIFTAWMPSPIGNSQLESVHALLGWRQILAPGIQFSVEGYRKWMRHLPVPVWSHLVQFTTELARANGDVYGADLRLEYNRGAFYGFAGYSYTFTEYTTTQDHFMEWFGEPVRRYSPPHDRRHQINTMASLELGKYVAGVRWELGTGMPFTRPMGFYELHSFRDKLPIVKHEFGTQMVIINDYLRGRMLTYHRLDVSLERTFDLSVGQLKLLMGATNLYNRENMFYYDVFSHRRVDQLPIAPYVSLKLELVKN
jgi:hypothetical protein